MEGDLKDMNEKNINVETSLVNLKKPYKVIYSSDHQEKSALIISKGDLSKVPGKSVSAIDDVQFIKELRNALDALEAQYRLEGEAND